VNALLDHLTAADLRELASARDFLDQCRQNNLEALLAGPALGAFAPDAPPLPPLLPEQLDSAMRALASRGCSGKGLARAAEGYAAGRLPPEIVARVVNDVLRRRKAAAL
jgi:hypothetical protein